jgi:hypothetical protein
MPHIPLIGDATTSPAGDLLASPNFEICDTTRRGVNIRDGAGTGYRPVRSGPVPVWISDRPVCRSPLDRSLPVDRSVAGRPVFTGRPAGYR